MLWGLIPLSPSPKSRAKVEIQIASEARVLPWVVSGIDPLAVAAIFVDEETGEVMKAEFLVRQTPPPSALTAFNVWELDFPDVDVTSQNIGVIVLVSKVPQAQFSLPAAGTQPDAACNGANVECYSADGGTSTRGPFVHPRIRRCRWQRSGRGS